MFSIADSAASISKQIMDQFLIKINSVNILAQLSDDQRTFRDKLSDKSLSWRDTKQQ